MQSGQHGAGGARPAGRAVGYVGSSAGAPPPTPGTCSVVSTVWRSSPRSEEELSELPECVLCERLVRRAERGVRSGARVPSLARVAGHAQRRARYGASRGDRVRGGRGGGERGRKCGAFPASDAGNQARCFVTLGPPQSHFARAIARARGTERRSGVGAPTTQRRCRQSARERSRSTP